MSNKISVLQTGAIPDCECLQTAAFQKALDEIFSQGGGTVEIPAGTYRIGGIRIRSDTVLYLMHGAKLIGSTNPEDYSILEDDLFEPIPDTERTDRVWERAQVGQPRDYSFLRAGGRWCHAILRAYDAQNISVIGEEGSCIDGCDVYDSIGEEHYRGPHGFCFHRCKHITLSGYTVANTGNWAHALFYCENIRCENVTVLGGHDGVHLTRCENIRISDCAFYTGDDCISGFGNLNTVVTDCICNTACSAFRFGGTNLLAEHCTAYGPAKYFFRGSLTPEERRTSAKVASAPRNNMLSFFTYYADHSTDIPLQPENLVFRNCSIRNADRFLHYNFSGNERWQMNRPLASVRFENIAAVGITMPLTAYGTPEVPLLLEIGQSTLSFADNMQNKPILRAAHCSCISLRSVSVEGANPTVLSWSSPLLLLTDGIPRPERVIPASEPFSCRSI